MEKKLQTGKKKFFILRKQLLAEIIPKPQKTYLFKGLSEISPKVIESKTIKNPN